MGLAAADTADRALPGGDIADFAAFLAETRARWPFLDMVTRERMAHAYGTRMAALMGEAASISDMGEDFGAGLMQIEVDYLIDVEWARTTDDILWRRSKLGLRLSAPQAARLGEYLASRIA